MKNCQKVVLSKEEADGMLKNIDHANQYRREKRAYYCKECNGWHLTSEEFKSGIFVRPAPIVHIDRWNKLINQTTA